MFRIKQGAKANDTEFFIKNLHFLIRPLDQNWSNAEVSSIWRTQKLLTDLGYTPNQTMYEVSKPCGILLQYCFWRKSEVPCTDLFRVVKNSEGYCCAFNSHGIKSELDVYVEFTLF